MKIVVAITGASGVIYGVELLKKLHKKVEVYLVVSETAKQILKNELQLAVTDLKRYCNHYYDNAYLDAPISSGWTKFNAMVIVPCSMSTLSKIACGIADNLITRTAAVCMKEKRNLVVVPRETPLSAVHLKNMYKLASLNVTVLPAMPAFYRGAKEVSALVEFIVLKILDALRVSPYI